MRPDESKTSLGGDFGVGGGVGRIETGFQVGGNAWDCEFLAYVSASSASAHRVKNCGWAVKPQKVFDEVATAIAGIAAVAMSVCAVAMVEAC